MVSLIIVFCAKTLGVSPQLLLSFTAAAPKGFRFGKKIETFFLRALVYLYPNFPP
jgi:hypothetical protein